MVREQQEGLLHKILIPRALAFASALVHLHQALLLPPSSSAVASVRCLRPRSPLVDMRSSGRNVPSIAVPHTSAREQDQELGMRLLRAGEDEAAKEAIVRDVLRRSGPHTRHDTV